VVEEILTDLGRGTITLVLLLFVAAIATAIERYFDKRKE
jgi:hypothetical protein